MHMLYTAAMYSCVGHMTDASEAAAAQACTTVTEAAAAAAAQACTIKSYSFACTQAGAS